MPDTFKKIDKEFVLSDSSVNVYNFRMLTSGWQREEFEKNPIGFYMHGDTEEYPRSMGVLVRWEDVRIEGDTIYAKPVVNLAHPRGQQTVDEIENGFLNGASFGGHVVLQCEELPDPANPEQTVLTVTRWYSKECSLVDVPGNRSAFAQPKLYDINGAEIPNLADHFNLNNPSLSMKTIALPITAALVALLNLSDDGKNATEKDLTSAIQNLSDRADKSDEYKTGKEKAENELKQLKQTNLKAQVQNLADTALTEGRITKKLSDRLVQDYASDPEGLKEVLAGYRPQESVVENIEVAGTAKATRIKNLSDKTWDDLDRNGGLAELKSLAPEVFAAKYEAEFGKKPSL